MKRELFLLLFYSICASSVSLFLIILSTPLQSLSASLLLVLGSFCTGILCPVVLPRLVIPSAAVCLLRRRPLSLHPHTSLSRSPSPFSLEGTRCAAV